MWTAVPLARMLICWDLENGRHFFQWVVKESNSWGITAFVASAASTATWIVARRREWKEARRVKFERKIDSKVLEALGNPSQSTQPRPMTGTGIPLVRAAEIAEQLSLNLEAVGDSLERLEARSRVVRSGGTFDNPAPYWQITLR